MLSLRFRITIASLVCVVIVSIGLQISSSLISDAWLERFESKVFKSNDVLWNKIIASQQDAMEAGLPAITRDRKIRKLIKAGDITALEEEASPAFRRLSASNIITKQQITGLTGTVLLSLPKAFSGQSDKALIKHAINEGKSFRGIEKDGNELVIELAFPILQRGKIVGAGIFMRSLQSALDDFKTNNSSDISIIYSDGTIDATTNPDLLQSLDIAFPKLGEKSYQEVTSEDKYYGISITPILNPLGQPLAHLVDIQDHTKSITASNSISHTSYAVIALMLIAVGSFFTFYIRLVFSPVEQAIHTMERISSGDLTMKISSGSNDEVGRLQLAMASMVKNLHAMITQLASMSERLDISGKELRTQSDDTKISVDSQLLETEQVATAMNQMSATVHEVAQSTVCAAQSADDANTNAQDGRAIVDNAITSIHSLHENIQASSETISKLQQETTEIGGVLKVIRGIAEQTNLLALNAAIEAARAGEQGRGFAVVADEVRTLAARTQQSTEDIDVMIERLQNGANTTVASMEISRNHVESNVNTIIQTGESLEKIADSVRSINDMNLQIASAAEEQSAVAEEINRNIVKINQISEDSAQRVGKTASASDEINKLTHELSKLVCQFKI